MATDLPSFTCPRCHRTSYNPNDVREGYCGACHDWTGAESDPIGDALRADAGQARAEIRAADIECPSCGVNMADLPRDHRLVLDHGGVDWERAERRPATAKCASGRLVPLDGASFETWQAAAQLSVWDDFRAREAEAFDKIIGKGPPRFTGFLDVLPPEADQ